LIKYVIYLFIYSFLLVVERTGHKCIFIPITNLFYNHEDFKIKHITYNILLSTYTILIYFDKLIKLKYILL